MYIYIFYVLLVKMFVLVNAFVCRPVAISVPSFRFKTCGETIFRFRPPALSLSRGSGLGPGCAHARLKRLIQPLDNCV